MRDWARVIVETVEGFQKRSEERSNPNPAMWLLRVTGAVFGTVTLLACAYMAHQPGFPHGGPPWWCCCIAAAISATVAVLSLLRWQRDRRRFDDFPHQTAVMG
jgi:dolichyl-phosphate-mannose--protein O-mannosyl transferase